MSFWFRKIYQSCNLNHDESVSVLEFLRYRYLSRCTDFLSQIFCRILHSVVLSDRHEDLAATFFCALDADRSGFLTEMDISLLSTESQSMKNRDVRDKVNFGGDSIRRGSDSKKSDGLKEFIRHALKMS